MLPPPNMLPGPKDLPELTGETLTIFERIKAFLTDATLLTHPALEAQLPLMPPSSGFTRLFTCVYRQLRWAEAIPLPNVQADTVVTAFVNIFGALSTVTTAQAVLDARTLTCLFATDWLRPPLRRPGTPTFGLSKWLYQRLCFLTKDSEWTVKSAEEFLTRIKHLEVEADEVMVSFDVISLFTSIPPALAIDTIDGFLREKYDETDQQLKRAHIIELLELCLKTFFTFNGQVYEQKKGTPMDSPLSGLIAEAVLQRFEQQVFSSYPPKFWARYVDDTFVVIKRSEVKAFKALLNSIFPDIQFTMEKEVNNQLPFLDVQITRLTDGKIRTTVYRKATNTRRILHFRSNHPVGHKRSWVRTLFQRLQTHCSDDSVRKEEMNYLQALFKANGCSKSFIRNCLKKPHFERSSGEKPKFWLSIPYAKNVSEATARILKPFGIGVAHKPECTIRQQIMKPKDPLPTTEQSAVVYSIPCLNCNARYVGETGKRLGARLHEHQLAINRKDKLSLVYGHIRELNHDFAFDKARVIGRANVGYNLAQSSVKRNNTPLPAKKTPPPPPRPQQPARTFRPPCPSLLPPPI
ncbi:hypothetical protein SprV_0602042900 [Sparganum proliferum]